MPKEKEKEFKKQDLKKQLIEIEETVATQIKKVKAGKEKIRKKLEE